MELLFCLRLYVVKLMADVNCFSNDLIPDDRYLFYDNDLAYYPLLPIEFMAFLTDIYPFQSNGLIGCDLGSCFGFYYCELSFIFILIVCFRLRIFYRSGRVSSDFFAIEPISFCPSYV